tara:strand:- start:1937 stop:2554 length:618 start_codon:yes stop_codon:yes gene_type:complete
MYYGQRETDKYIAEYFAHRLKGNCIEVGVANGIKGSNTLMFEEAGWDTLCIDPIPEHVAEAKEFRKQVLECACGNFNGYDWFTSYDIGEEHIQSSLSSLNTDKRLLETHKDVINDTDTFMVRVKRLTAILDEQNWTKHIDFVSVDTEGTELDVLRGLDLGKYEVKLLVVENNFEDPEIAEYLECFGFEHDQRFFVNDFFVNRNLK